METGVAVSVIVLLLAAVCIIVMVSCMVEVGHYNSHINTKVALHQNLYQ